MLSEWTDLSLRCFIRLMIREPLIKKSDVTCCPDITANGNHAPVYNVSVSTVGPDFTVTVKHPPLRPSAVSLLVGKNYT